MKYIVILIDYDERAVFKEILNTKEEAEAYVKGYNQASLRFGLDTQAELVDNIPR